MMGNALLWASRYCATVSLNTLRARAGAMYHSNLTGATRTYNKRAPWVLSLCYMHLQYSSKQGLCGAQFTAVKLLAAQALAVQLMVTPDAD